MILNLDGRLLLLQLKLAKKLLLLLLHLIDRLSAIFFKLSLRGKNELLELFSLRLTCFKKLADGLREHILNHALDLYLELINFVGLNLVKVLLRLADLSDSSFKAFRPRYES